MLAQILQDTPIWAFGLLLLLFGLGWVRRVAIAAALERDDPRFDTQLFPGACGLDC